MILSLDYAGDVPQYIVGDSVRIRQLISNLVSNAIKFTDKGEVNIIISKVDDESIPSEKVKIKVSVKDSGIGIPKEKQPQLFEAFTQVDGSVSRKYGGTGLGLSICKRLVEMMNGEIGVTSSHGHGSLFWFTAELKINNIPNYSIWL